MNNLEAPRVVTNLDNYNQQMSSSLEDKIDYINRFCRNHGTFDVLIDFGCADGQLTNALASSGVAKFVIGYDISKEMIRKARANFSRPGAKVSFASTKSELFTTLSHFRHPRIAMNFSSVTHEIFSFDFVEDVKVLITRINPEIIFVRDMSFDAEVGTSIDIAPFLATCDSKYIEEYEAQNECKLGETSSLSQDVEFLIKSRYLDNWEYEVKENYFSFDKRSQYELFSNYKEDSRCDYTLDYIADDITKRCGVDMQGIATHTKIVFKRV